MNYFHNTKLRILNFTHSDMDGATANIVVRNYYNKVITEPISHLQENTIVQKMIKYKDDFDAILFTDYCPQNLNEIKAFGKPVLVLDHHETVKKFNNPKEFVYVCTGFCGAKLVYEYLNHDDCLKHLKELVDIVNDIDLYINKDPRSKHYNALYWEMGFNWFVNRFYIGEIELNKSEKAFLVRRQKEYKEYFDSLEISELRNGGVFCYSEKFLHEIVESLYAEGYKWCIVYRAGYLSVRSSNDSGIDLTEVVKTLGRGGGLEHAVGIPQNKDVLDKLIQSVDEAVDTAIKLKTNPPADEFMNKLQGVK